MEDVGTVRERQLTNNRPPKGRIIDAALHEDLEGLWTIYVMTSWRGEKWLTVVDYGARKSKAYKSLTTAIAHVRDCYDYFGKIMLTTDRNEATPPLQTRGRNFT